jgi:nucleoside-diphosphate-sugar epimerase
VAIVALTGGTGFIGQRLIAYLVEHGHQVRALTRRPQTEMPGVTWVEGDLDHTEALAQLCANCDVIIHMAGVIKGLHAADFERGNVAGTANILGAATTAGVSRFLHISSLVARAPKLSHYSRSKAAAEDLVRATDLDWTILRPPGVYGPGDRETLALFKAAKGPLMPVAMGRAKVSWIYVDDLCAAISAAIAPSLRHTIIEVDDGTGGYTHRQFAHALARAVGGTPKIVALPKFIIWTVGFFNQLISHRRGKAAMLTPGKAREIFYHDWSVRDANLNRLTKWQPHVPLASGLKTTARWLKAQKWL